MALAVSLCSLLVQSAQAEDWKFWMMREEPVLRTLAIGQAALFLMVLMWEFKANRDDKMMTLEIDRLAAAATMKQSRVNESISSDDLGLSPALVARTQDAPPYAPPPVAPAAAAPPAQAAPAPPVTAPPVPARTTPPPPPPMTDFSAHPPPPAMPSMPSMSEPAPNKLPPLNFPAPAQAGAGGADAAGGWAELLHRVRAGDGEGTPDRPGVPKFPSGEGDALKRSAPPVGGGGDAWEALLKKTAAPSGGLNFNSGEGVNPFAKMLGGGGTGSVAGAPNPFAKGIAPGASGEDLQGPRNPLADESVPGLNRKGPNRSISLGFGSVEKPPGES
jgi:hypothetical protein